MKKTMIGVILDASGSMSHLRNDVIGGINTFIREQKAIEGEAIFTAVRFSYAHDINTFRPIKNLNEVTEINSDEYRPNGSTALLDAIGKTIQELDLAWQQYSPEQAVLVIYTDGEENDSKQFTRAQIKEMIQKRQNIGKWSFVFLGANLDSFAEAKTLGIWEKSVSNYVPTMDGLTASYNATSASVGMMRSRGIDTYYSDASLASVADTVAAEEKKLKK